MTPDAIYTCKRCDQRVEWQSWHRKDMYEMGMCGWCTSYVTYLPRKIKLWTVVVIFSWLWIPGLSLFYIGEGMFWLYNKIRDILIPYVARREDGPDPKERKQP